MARAEAGDMRCTSCRYVSGRGELEPTTLGQVFLGALRFRPSPPHPAYVRATNGWRMPISALHSRHRITTTGGTSVSRVRVFCRTGAVVSSPKPSEGRWLG